MDIHNSRKQSIIDTIFKILMLISLFILFVSIISFKPNECQKCKFEIENKTINGLEFMKYYQEKCISPGINYRKEELNFSILTG